jgi:hypothetical protein
LLLLGGTDPLILKSLLHHSHHVLKTPIIRGDTLVKLACIAKGAFFLPTLYHLRRVQKKKTLGKDKKAGGKKSVDGKSSSRKRRKLEHAETEKKKERSASSSPEPVTKKSWASRVLLDDSAASLSSSPDIKNGESLSALRDMVHGRVEYNANQRL